jgi:hypothetical protein
LNQDGLRTYDVTLRPRRDGEFFLYVNDAASALPAVGRYFYENNSGTATVTIKRVGRGAASSTVEHGNPRPGHRLSEKIHAQ